MQIPRSRQRTIVDIPVIITTVLDSLEGVIADISEGGAQIVGCTLPARNQCQIDFEGHVVFGTVQWSEPDRMGIRFPFELTEGPLFDMLEMARAVRHVPAAVQPRGATARFHPAPAAGFGRRIS